MKTYFPLLDLLRFFAAFWVMSFHYFLWYSGELAWYRYGNLGVPLFFIISGFVISQSVAHASTKTFALGRFIRLFPLFWILCTLTYIFTLLMPNGHPVSFPEYLISMTMLGENLDKIFHYAHLVDPAYWSLVIELIFYVAIGSFVHFFKWKNVRWFTAMWFCITVGAFIINLDHTFIAKTLLARHASYFLYGITLMLIGSSTYTSLKMKIYDYAFLVTVALYGSLMSYRALPPYLTPHPLDTIIVTIIQFAFFIGVASLVYLSRFINSKKWIDLSIIIGGLTYPLYLIHQTIGNTLIDYFKGYGSVALRSSFVMILMIIAAFIIYRQDKKLRRWLTVKLLPSKLHTPRTVVLK